MSHPPIRLQKPIPGLTPGKVKSATSAFIWDIVLALGPGPAAEALAGLAAEYFDLPGFFEVSLGQFRDLECESVMKVVSVGEELSLGFDLQHLAFDDELGAFGQLLGTLRGQGGKCRGQKKKKG